MSATVVRVTSRRAPSITWPCPRCRSQAFDCSERFRANSNGKLVDIWSIYRCRDCESTKNVTIVERTPVSRVPRALLLAAEHNDAALAARAYARDVGVLRRNGMAVGDGDDWEVDGTAEHECTLVFDEPLLVRLDTIAAAVLGTREIAVDARQRVDRLNLWTTTAVRLAAPLGAPSRRHRAASR